MSKNLPILAIETSGEVCGAAILVNEKNYSEINLNFKNIHSEKIISLVEQNLRNTKIKPEDLACIAVSIGPGSFTGLRIGLAVAKGLAFGWELPICPVNTMEAMGLQISGSLKKDVEFFIAVNANMEETYLAKFKTNDSGAELLEEIESVNKKVAIEKIKDNLVFGNLKGIEQIKYLSHPRSIYVAKWAYLFGKDLLSFDFDYLEPRYFKEFLPGGRR